MREPRVIVVGAGPAGTRAAEVLVAAGLVPVVVDEGATSGGQVYRRSPPSLSRRPAQVYGYQAAKAEALHAAFDRLGDRLDHWRDSLAWAVREKTLHVLRDGVSRALPFDALILTTGAVDRLLPFPGWTLPGVYSLGGAQVALKAHGCAIGARVAFLGSTPLLYLVAWQYAKAGASPVAVFDCAPLAAKRHLAGGLRHEPRTLLQGLWYAAQLYAKGVPLAFGARPVRIEGETSVSALVVRDRQGRERRIACDALAVGFGLKPESQLAELAGAAFRFDGGQGQWLAETDPWGRAAPGLYLAGDGARVCGADGAEAAGALAARAVLADLGLPAPPGFTEATLRGRLDRALGLQAAFARAFPLPAGLAAGLADGDIACRCEAVTAGEIRDAVRRDVGATEVNRAKAFTRVGMGRCQGRFCEPGAAEIVAATLGVPVAQVGRLRAAAPVKPIPMGLPLADADADG